MYITLKMAHKVVYSLFFRYGAVTKLIFPSNTLLTLQQAVKEQTTNNYCFPIRLFGCLGASLVCFRVGWNR